MITVADIVTTVFSRNIDASNFKDGDVELALQRYVRINLGDTLYDAIVADQVTYATFISTYILPVVAYGVAVDKFEAIRVAITDRGIQAMLGDGMSQASDHWLLKKQFALNRDKYIEIMTDYADENYSDDYDEADYPPQEVYYESQTKRTNHV